MWEVVFKENYSCWVFVFFEMGFYFVYIVFFVYNKGVVVEG